MSKRTKGTKGTAFLKSIQYQKLDIFRKRFVDFQLAPIHDRERVTYRGLIADRFRGHKFERFFILTRNFPPKKKLKLIIMSISKSVTEIIEMRNQNIEFIIEEIEEPEVPTEFQNCQLSQADIYYKFRYTFSDEDVELNERRAVMKLIIHDLRRFMIDGKYVAGIEKFTKGMVDAAAHCHIHFVSRTKKDTIRKWLKRHDESGIFHRNKCYALPVEVDVNCDKFWRYPLKQQKNDTAVLVLSEGFSVGQLRKWTDEAYAVWITACEVENKKIEKKENTDALSDRLFVHLDKLDKKDDISLKIGIQQFYIVEEQRPFNRTTALGYFYNYKIMRGLMTHEQLASTW